MTYSKLFVLATCACVSFAADHPANHEFLNATLWAQSAIEHDAVYLQSYKLARIQLDRALKDKKWTAAIEQTGKFSKLPPAIILDIDETVLDNSPGQGRLANADVDWSASMWRQWTDRATAVPLPGAVEFTRYARSRGVTVFFITNREAGAEEEATRKNLSTAGFPLTAAGGPMIDTVLCRGEKPDWTSDKASRRTAVAASYRILMLLGDDLGDFISPARGSVEERKKLVTPYLGWFGEKWIALPNAMYGSWEGAVYNNEANLTRRQKLDRKFGALRTE